MGKTGEEGKDDGKQTSSAPEPPAAGQGPDQSDGGGTSGSDGGRHRWFRGRFGRSR